MYAGVSTRCYLHCFTAGKKSVRICNVLKRKSVTLGKMTKNSPKKLTYEAIIYQYLIFEYMSYIRNLVVTYRTVKV
jgi:hypothetical protein